jgi:type VI secretion system VasD/TssJ family lipoprotein
MERMNQTLAFLLAGLLLLGGCSATRDMFSSPPTTVHVIGDVDMNEGNAARVYIYELSGDTNFRTTTLSTFWSDDEEALGDELIGVLRQWLLYPNQRETLEFEVSEKTRYIGIAANLRNPDRERWRSVHSVEEVKGEEIVVRIVEDRVEVEVQ